jgi:hypothetical protein
MLREFFARVPHVNVRQRFFEDESGLERWCRELMYLAEPTAVVFASHGNQDGLMVNGKPLDGARISESLKHADNILLLHFSSCLAMQNDSAGKLVTELKNQVRFPISGYDRTVDWAASALIEFHYLDMVLARRLSPPAAAAQVYRLISYAGKEELADSPYRPAGFKIILPKPGTE